MSLSTAGQTLTGQRVCIHGVQTRTKLNGAYGRVIAIITERGRYAVELEGSREHVQMDRDGLLGACQMATAQHMHMCMCVCALAHQSVEPQSHGY